MASGINNLLKPNCVLCSEALRVPSIKSREVDSITNTPKEDDVELVELNAHLQKHENLNQAPQSLKIGAPAKDDQENHVFW